MDTTSTTILPAGQVEAAVRLLGVESPELAVRVEVLPREVRVFTLRAGGGVNLITGKPLEDITRYVVS